MTSTIPRRREFYDRLKALSTCELIAYGAFVKCRYENIATTMENIHFEVINYILKFKPEIHGERDIIKILRKLATPNPKTQEWTLKDEYNSKIWLV